MSTKSTRGYLARQFTLSFSYGRPAAYPEGAVFRATNGRARKMHRRPTPTHEEDVWRNIRDIAVAVALMLAAAPAFA